MAETLGTLVDKLTIVDLKLWHCQEALFKPASGDMDQADAAKMQDKNVSLLEQRQRLIKEIDEWFARAMSTPEGMVLTSPQNKMYGRFRKD